MKNRLQYLTQAFLRRNDGNVGMIFGLVALTLMVFADRSWTMARLGHESPFAGVLGQCALAGILAMSDPSATDQEIEQASLDAFNANFERWIGKGASVSGFTVTQDRNEQIVRVSGTASLPTIILKVAQMDSFDVAETAEAREGGVK